MDVSTRTVEGDSMTGAIEFLRKAKSIDNLADKEKFVISVIDYLYGKGNEGNVEIVRKVMAYQLKEDKDAEGN